MTFISYAQNFEDVMLYRALKHIEKGFYIDVGAWDPIEASVTKAFYERGWRGINIEPVRLYFDRLVLDRPEDTNLMIVAGGRNGLERLFEVAETGLSTMDETLADRWRRQGWDAIEREIPCATLAEICHANSVNEVHFLKIDVEGAEKAVLEGLDLSRVRPWIVVVEAVEPLSTVPSFEAWEPLLLEQEYDFVYFDGLNRFYVSKERPELGKAFRAPPNVHDEFVRYSERRDQAEREALQAEREALQAEREALQKQVEELVQARDQAEALRAEQAARLAKLSAVLSVMQTEKEELRIEKEALREQVKELNRWLQAVYASICWRITAPLRLAKTALVGAITGIRRLLAEVGRLPFRLARRGLVKVAHWAARDPRMRSLGKRLLARNPAALAKARRLVSEDVPRASASASMMGQHPQAADLTELPEGARQILSELQRMLACTREEHAHDDL